MTHFRFSLATFFIAILPIAFASAALASGSRLWAKTAFTFAIGVLLFATLGAFFGAAKNRIFWTGFALFGWTYLALAFGPWFNPKVVDRALVTGAFLDGLYPYWKTTEGANAMEPYRPVKSFHDVGHSVLSLLWASIGGGLAAVSFGKSPRSVT